MQDDDRSLDGGDRLDEQFSSPAARGRPVVTGGASRGTDRALLGRDAARPSR